MKVLLIFPKKNPFNKEKEYLKTYIPSPPMGITIIASVLRENNIDVSLLD